MRTTGADIFIQAVPVNVCLIAAFVTMWLNLLLYPKGMAEA